jgi:hypothetical protein
MAKPVRVTITGPAEGQEKAPTADDLLAQIRDFLAVLRGVEKAVDAGGSELVWRVTDARMNSPISVELTPYGRGPAADVGARADNVERIAVEGIKALRRGERPAYFTAAVIKRARQMHERVLNGLSDTVISVDPEIAAEPVVIDRPAARELETAIERSKGLASFPYTELGSIEGFVTKPELDGYQRAILRFKARLGGAEIKAFASDNAFRQVEAMTLHDIWEGVRIRVYGTIHYTTLGQILHINATGIEVLDEEPLPGIDDIVDPSFTGGLSTEEFLREQRRDD